MRAMIMLAVTVALLAVACGGGGNGAALEAVVRVHYRAGAPVTTEPKLGDQECAFYEEGPPLLAPATPIPISGICHWEAERSGEDWIVSFTQTWSCQDFRASIEGEESCTGERGAHTWRYRLDREGGVTSLGDSGDFPPQWVE